MSVENKIVVLDIFINQVDSYTKGVDDKYGKLPPFILGSMIGECINKLIDVAFDQQPILKEIINPNWYIPNGQLKKSSRVTLNPHNMEDVLKKMTPVVTAGAGAGLAVATAAGIAITAPIAIGAALSLGAYAAIEAFRS